MADVAGWLIPSNPWDERFPVSVTSYREVPKIPVYAREDGVLTLVEPQSLDDLQKHWKTTLENDAMSRASFLSDEFEGE